MSARPKHFLTVDGVRVPLCFTPSAAMARAMRKPYAPFPYSDLHLEQDVIGYCQWLATRDGATVPPVAGHKKDGVRAIVEWEWIYDVPNARRRGGSERRPRAVRWEQGIWSDYRTELVWRTRKRQRVQVEERTYVGGTYGPGPDWHAETVLLRIEIPNWDHIPSFSETQKLEAAQ